MFLSYQDFPWFQDIPIRQILNIQEPFPNHFYWPDLDVDLSTDSKPFDLVSAEVPSF